MKITVVIENRSFKEEIIPQYGLSLLVETKGKCFLIDCGQDECSFRNLKELGYDIYDIEKIVISHNHFDHMKGLSAFLEERADLKVVVSSQADTSLFTKRYLKKSKVSCNDYFNRYRDNFVCVEDVKQIFDNVYACRVANPKKEYMCKDPKLKEMDKHTGKLIRDRFKHEIYIVVVEGDECKIISSCSHNGVINIVEDAKERFPDYRVTAFVGGLHLRGEHRCSLNCSRRYVREIVDYLQASGVKTLQTGHCTGEKAYRLIEAAKKIDVHYFSSGDSFSV